MNKVKTIILASVFVFGTNANATDINDVTNELVKQKTMFVNHISMQVEKTKTYQKKSWADGKAQLIRNKNQIINLFKKVTGNDTQN
tara:strand:- start:1006 stop:1263 length:258 start_codon:yes stop_codon:yes gene_type:complete